MPYLDVVAALDDTGKKLTLFCVDRHLTLDIPGSIRLTGFTADASRGLQLTAATLYAENDDLRPDAIVPNELNLRIKGSDFRYTFPKMSVIVIALERAQSKAPSTSQ
ncbi:MAG: hypothetical protein ACJ74Y_09235 [Bryobacteraceae bacterium]